jgi:inorganic pyrophosphatase
MSLNIKNLPIGKEFPEVINAVIEIPKHSRNKYEYDEELDVIRLDRVMHSPLIYPADYGFIPQTRAEDGDHLDVLVLTESPAMTGTMMEVRPVGVMHMLDGGVPDEKIIAVQSRDPRFTEKKDLGDIREHTLLELKHFFEEYKALENKNVEIDGFEDRAKAIEIIKRTHEEYKKRG